MGKNVGGAVVDCRLTAALHQVPKNQGQLIQASVGVRRIHCPVYRSVLVSAIVGSCR